MKVGFSAGKHYGRVCQLWLLMPRTWTHQRQHMLQSTRCARDLSGEAAVRSLFSDRSLLVALFFLGLRVLFGLLAYCFRERVLTGTCHYWELLLAVALRVFSHIRLSLSLPRVINFKFLQQPHAKFCITQDEELGFSQLTQMKDDYTTNISL